MGAPIMWLSMNILWVGEKRKGKKLMVVQIFLAEVRPLY